MTPNDEPAADSFFAGRVKRILRNAIRALEGSAGAILLPERLNESHAIDSGTKGWNDRLAGHIPELYLTIGLRARARRALYSALSLALPAASRAASDTSRSIMALPYVVDGESGLPDAPLLDRFVIMPIADNGALIGLIAVLRSAIAFSAAERRVLDAFAGQVAISVENALLAQRLHEQREQAETIIEKSADGIVQLDGDLRIDGFNRALELLTGVHRWEALGRYYADVLALIEPTAGDPRREPRRLANLALLFAQSLDETPRQTRTNIDAVLLARDGRQAVVALLVFVNRRHQGGIASVTIYVRDMTHAQQLDQLRSAFLSMTSHELQTPVAIIKAYAESLERRTSANQDRVLRDALVAIEDECDRLSRLVANLLRVSRIEAGALTLRAETVDLADIGRRVIRRIAPRAGPTFTFRLNIGANIPSILGDEERIEEILTNLLDNAVKYSPNGGEITVSAVFPDRRGYDAVEVHVRDEGPGIPMREVGQLFDRFYRSSSASGSQTTGAGLGLYLARAMVRAHGGEMWVESVWGHGATFIFTLPRTGPGQRSALPLDRSLALDAPDRVTPHGG